MQIKKESVKQIKIINLYFIFMLSSNSLLCFAEKFVD